MTARRAPDLTILCSRRRNTVTARVFGGVLVPTLYSPTDAMGGMFDERLRGPLDLRPIVDSSDSLVHGVRCRCGEVHGTWAARTLLRLRGKVTTAELDPGPSRDW